MTRYAAATILVVEDHDSLRRLIIRLLKRRGYRTLEACDGIEALSRLDAASDPIDLVILDMMMPRLSGLDVAAELGRRAPETKVLYLTGNSTSIAIEGIRRQSPQSLLLKPFTEEVLLDRIGGMLGTASE